MSGISSAAELGTALLIEHISEMFVEVESALQALSVALEPLGAVTHASHFLLNSVELVGCFS